jgi:YHS domain-containing protein
MLRFLFWVLILSWAVALLRRAVAWMLSGGATDAQQGGAVSGGTQNSSPKRRLVRDPVCGVHVAENLAIPLHENGGVVHFCSTECRDKYAGSVRRFAANG